MKLSKTFGIEGGDKLNFSFDYDRANNSISGLEVIFSTASDVKNCSFIDITDLFEKDKELYAFTDTVIDNAIKNI